MSGPCERPFDSLRHHLLTVPPCPQQKSVEDYAAKQYTTRMKKSAKTDTSPSTGQSLHSVQRIIQISDCHLGHHHASKVRGFAPDKRLNLVLEHIKTHDHSDLILATGDLCHDQHDDRAYKRLYKKLKALKLPLAIIPGNHDENHLLEPVFHDAMRLGGHDIGPWRMILLDSNTKKGHHGHMLKPELKRLEKELKQHPSQPTLVVLHHHPVLTDCRWLDDYRLFNADEFLAIIEQHAQIKTVLWGHVHHAMDSMHGDIRMLGCPSTAMEFDRAAPEFDTNDGLPAYRWLELSPDGGIQTGIVEVGA